jgi:hypothetical protein
MAVWNGLPQAEIEHLADSVKARLWTVMGDHGEAMKYEKPRRFRLREILPEGM